MNSSNNSTLFTIFVLFVLQKPIRSILSVYIPMKNEIILYQSDDLLERIEVRLDEETVWLTLNQMSSLFGRDKSVISRHLRNIYKEKELNKQATVVKIATVQLEADRTVKRDIEYYNLDAILSVDYRVNSKQGTQFRIWATNILRDYLLKGYALNNRLNRIEDKVDKMDRRIDKIDIQIQSNQLPRCLYLCGGFNPKSRYVLDFN